MRLVFVVSGRRAFRGHTHVHRTHARPPDTRSSGGRCFPGRCPGSSGADCGKRPSRTRAFPPGGYRRWGWWWGGGGRDTVKKEAGFGGMEAGRDLFREAGTRSMDSTHIGGDMSPLYVPRKRRTVQSQPKSAPPCPGKRWTETLHSS
ncbi:unnamed protein product [Menidia menidia]|uniref:(Atlantic silverside) hypothetical protein n=1 Tax=Menidia menidia TaxID=238744 RepID=A0A8S4B1U5_9TELE|nr:unnamed protein product [Menidia menidia]